jgi:hypothetical protein
MEIRIMWECHRNQRRQVASRTSPSSAKEQSGRVSFLIRGSSRMLQPAATDSAVPSEFAERWPDIFVEFFKFYMRVVLLCQ